MHQLRIAVAVLVVIGAFGVFANSRVGSGMLAAEILRAQGASAALAYLDGECDECYGESTYYTRYDVPAPIVTPGEESGWLWNAAPRAVSGVVADPAESEGWYRETSWLIEPEPISYFYNDPSDIVIDIGPEYITDTIYIVDEPWYESAFPGFGGLVTHILPPIARTVAQPQAPAPTCSIAAQPSAIRAGGSTVVTWATSNSARTILSGYGEVAGTGSRTYSNLAASQSFALTVSGLGGTNTCYTQVTVQAALHPSCLISAHPSSIAAGETANIAWTSQNAARLSLSGFGDVSQSGGLVVAPRQTTTYTLSVSAASGESTSCSVTLGVHS